MCPLSTRGGGWVGKALVAGPLKKNYFWGFPKILWLFFDTLFLKFVYYRRFIKQYINKLGLRESSHFIHEFSSIYFLFLKIIPKINFDNLAWIYSYVCVGLYCIYGREVGIEKSIVAFQNSSWKDHFHCYIISGFNHDISII